MLIAYQVQKFGIQSAEYKALTIGFGQYENMPENLYISTLRPYFIRRGNLISFYNF